jgi:hypothetical protein
MRKEQLQGITDRSIVLLLVLKFVAVVVIVAVVGSTSSTFICAPFFSPMTAASYTHGGSKCL